MLFHDLSLSEPQLAILLLLVVEAIPLSEVGSPEMQSHDVELLQRLGFMLAGAHAFALTPAGFEYLRCLVNSKSTPMILKSRPPLQ